LSWVGQGGVLEIGTLITASHSAFMLTLQELLAKADDCEQRAKEVTDGTAAYSLLKTAASLRRVANGLKRLENDPLFQALLAGRAEE
jgi:hypothetical protein